MSAPVNGGPAFPREDYQTNGRDDSKGGQQGMTLRDYFAAKAMQGLCANPGGPFQASERSGWGPVNCTFADVANDAYAMADSMLAERTK